MLSLLVRTSVKRRCTRKSCIYGVFGSDNIAPGGVFGSDKIAPGGVFGSDKITRDHPPPTGCAI